MKLDGLIIVKLCFLQQTIKDLFSEPSGLDSLVKKEDDDKGPSEAAELKVKSMKEVAGGEDETDVSDTKVLNQFEKVSIGNRQFCAVFSVSWRNLLGGGGGG